ELSASHGSEESRVTGPPRVERPNPSSFPRDGAAQWIDEGSERHGVVDAGERLGVSIVHLLGNDRSFAKVVDRLTHGELSSRAVGLGALGPDDLEVAGI